MKFYPAARSCSLAVVLLAAMVALGAARAQALSASYDAPLTPRTFSEISKKVLPSVVSIEIQREISAPARSLRWRFNPRQGPAPGQPQAMPREYEDFFRRFFDQMPGQDQEQDEEGSTEETPGGLKFRAAGSGFISAVDGSSAYIVTNAHVVDGSKSGDISVIFDDSLNSEEISGDRVKIIERDTLGDLAVLQVVIGKMLVQPVEWGNSDNLEVGEWVLALGNPLDLRQSVTQGIISAKHREINKSAIEDLIQTTASINPGNSGGPLVNLDGHVVGVNNAIATRTGGWQGVGFAIPSNYASKIAEQIVKSGKIRRGYLGIEMSALEEPVAKYFEIDKPNGIIISRVHENTGADKANTKPYDVIVEVDGQPIKDAADMLRSIATKEVGSKVALTVVRSENLKKVEPKKITLTAVLGERPSDDELDALRTGKPLPSGEAKKFGLSFDQKKRSEKESKSASVPGMETGDEQEGIQGLRLTGVARGSNADKAGMREGDVIMEVNRIPVKNTAEFNAALEKKPSNREEHLIKFMRQGPGGWAALFTTMQTSGGASSE